MELSIRLDRHCFLTRTKVGLFLFMEPAMPTKRNPDLPEEVARRQLALAVETLSNIHYLIEQSCDDPDSVKKFVEMAAPAMEVLRAVAWHREPKSPVQSINPQESQTSLPGDSAGDHGNPLPLAAAGEDNPTSGAEAPPETRVDRLDAD
jgi:hypothetical protein